MPGLSWEPPFPFLPLEAIPTQSWLRGFRWVVGFCSGGRQDQTGGFQSEEVWSLEGFGLCTAPRPPPRCQHQQPLPQTAHAPLLTASRPSGPRAARVRACSLAAPAGLAADAPWVGSPWSTFLAAVSWKAEVGERRGRSQALGAMRFKTRVSQVCGPPAA